MDLSEPVSLLPGAGIFYQRKLKKLNILTLNDLLYHVPSRYIDYSINSKIGTLQMGETVTIKGEVASITNNYVKGKRLTIQKAVITDDTGSINITWFNQPYLVKILQGRTVNVAGKVSRFGRKFTMESPEYEIIKEAGSVHTGRLVPVYPETSGISSKWLRQKIVYLLLHLPFIKDPLPESILNKANLIGLNQAIRTLHQPQNQEQINLSRKRLAFDELFYLQLISLIRKRQWQKVKVGKKLEVIKFLPKIQQFVKNLPFELTMAQKRAAKEILTDLAKERPMNRLLQGDVGSGKTVVSAIAVFTAYLNGGKSLFMAPTEILALQHYQTLSRLLTPDEIKISLKTSSYKKGGQNYHLLIGTHALLHNKKPFEKVALVIIDEQHRFGVEQRARLRKQNLQPHLLTMTATPIPRTIALTLYGELDMSIIDQMPKGRKIVKTFVVPKEKYIAAYNWIEKKVVEGRQKGKIEQAYIICPLIEESEILTEVKAAKEEYERLRRDVFPNFRLGLLHGKMKGEEKSKVIDRFRKGDLDILIATSVVEVGMDIPNATIIAIEGADRFGLSQLHQLRGRVGRSDKGSYCLLFSQKETARLAAMEKYNLGIKLAEIDLKIRGAGEIYGTKQHGSLNLKIADFQDLILIEEARQAAEKLLENDPSLDNYPLLKGGIRPFLEKKVQPD